MHARRQIPLLLALTAALAGCDATGPDESSDYFITANIDGVAWSSTPSMIIAVGTAGRPGSISFQGGSISGATGRSLAFNLSRIPGPGTYPLGMNINTATGGIATTTLGSVAWTTPLSGRAGTITITEIDTERIRGTFDFTADVMASGTPQSTRFTDGRFSVPRNPEYVPATRDQEGSQMTATIAGQPFNGATIIANAPATGQFVISASNSEYSVTMIVGPLPGPGTGPISVATPPLRRITVQRLPSGGFWGGTAGDQGTVTIATWTATRITGSFSGTLAPSPGSPGAPLVITGATFDVRLGN